MEEEDGNPLLVDERKLECGMHIRSELEKAACPATTNTRRLEPPSRR